MKYKKKTPIWAKCLKRKVASPPSCPVVLTYRAIRQAWWASAQGLLLYHRPPRPSPSFPDRRPRGPRCCPRLGTHLYLSPFLPRRPGLVGHVVPEKTHCCPEPVCQAVQNSSFNAACFCGIPDDEISASRQCSYSMCENMKMDQLNFNATNEVQSKGNFSQFMFEYQI